ncbi:hypothetical protein DSECCO2_338930 [anaerobic digester metagenome]
MNPNVGFSQRNYLLQGEVGAAVIHKQKFILLIRCQYFCKFAVNAADIVLLIVAGNYDRNGERHSGFVNHWLS